MHGCQKKRGRWWSWKSREFSPPSSFLQPVILSRLLVFRIREAMLSNLWFGRETKRKRGSSFSFSLPPSISLSFFPLSWKVSVRCKVSRFYWSQSFTGSVRFVEFSKKLHSLLPGTVYADVKFVLHISCASCQRKRDVKLRKYTSNFSILPFYNFSYPFIRARYFRAQSGFELCKYLIVCWCRDRLHFWKRYYWRFNHVVFFFF